MSDEALIQVPRQTGLYQVAYHEAGHFVLACITGVYFPDNAGLSRSAYAPVPRQKRARGNDLRSPKKKAPLLRTTPY